MGEFRSGKWIVALSLYFFMFFLVIFSVVSASSEMGLESGVTYTNPGFFNASSTGAIDNITTTPDSSNAEWGAVKSTLGVMTGFTANIGLPNEVQFIFSFLFFWVPGLAYLWAIYMAIPFLH